MDLNPFVYVNPSWTSGPIVLILGSNLSVWSDRTFLIKKLVVLKSVPNKSENPTQLKITFRIWVGRSRLWAVPALFEQGLGRITVQKSGIPA